MVGGWRKIGIAFEEREQIAIWRLEGVSRILPETTAHLQLFASVYSLKTAMMLVR